jgi:hypothetical protein
MTSPSTRRRSMETTISMIQEVYTVGAESDDGKLAKAAGDGLVGVNGNSPRSGDSSPRG